MKKTYHFRCRNHIFHTRYTISDEDDECLMRTGNLEKKFRLLFLFFNFSLSIFIKALGKFNQKKSTNSYNCSAFQEKNEEAFFHLSIWTNRTRWREEKKTNYILVPKFPLSSLFPLILKINKTIPTQSGSFFLCFVFVGSFKLRRECSVGTIIIFLS